MSLATIIYTDGVPADMDADDIGIADARSNLTELVSHVRLLRRVKFLTNRNRRMAAIVPADLGELIRSVGTDEAAAVLRAARGRD